VLSLAVVGGFAILEAKSKAHAIELVKGGAYGTNFWIEPKEKLVGVLMIQMQAIVESP
jgi:hypothetical protein